VSKNLKILLTVVLSLMVAAPVMAANFTFHGDFDNRATVYTDQINFFGNDSGSQSLTDDDAPDSFVTTKYRMWFEAETNDGKVKGVYAIEYGGRRFGSSGGGGFSGDGILNETRWAYTDFQLPSVESKARFRIGLQTHSVNKYFWNETAMGVKFYGDNYYLAWFRGVDNQAGNGDDWGDNDLDAISARYDLKMEPVKVGFFLTYFWEDIPSGTVPDLTGFNALANYTVKKLPNLDFNLLAIGVDGSWSTATNFGKAFVNWDLIYENGSIDDVNIGLASPQDLDLSAYLLHADLGLTFGKATVTYTIIWASGDDDPDDTDLDGFMQVDVDDTYSIIFNEGGYTNDDYFSERTVIADKGIFLNKLALDFAATPKLKVGIAGLYLLLAEDVELATGAKEDSLGFEIDAYIAYKLYPNLGVFLNIGYLASGDAMDAFEVGPTAGDGDGDVDVLKSTARVRYGF
jgi:hypothetical protein